MAFGVTFKRYEKKYLLNPEQFDILKAEVDKRFNPDKYGETKICNIYYDTPEYLLVTRSISKPIFKEKLRLRTYGVPTDDTTAFIEVKRKYNSVVYKRRMHMPYVDAVKHIANPATQENDEQITKEINYLINFYKNLEPQFYLSYDRQAFFYKETSDIRVTFDRNITWRDYDLDLRKGSYGESLLPEGYTVMELKVPNTAPLWLAELLSKLKLYPTSFSKVGTAYKTMLAKKINASVISTANPNLMKYMHLSTIGEINENTMIETE
ncbi:MAG: polyphosphate polymerase domain-containing protein [Clostridia bacterium]|nr:polyphosphate polymerase domain-containing protein [Clostridia bacterium]